MAMKKCPNTPFHALPPPHARPPLQMKMDPTAFRTQLLQNFRVRLGPGELGAVFTAFDKDNSKLIDGTEVSHVPAGRCRQRPSIRCVCSWIVRSRRIACAKDRMNEGVDLLGF